MAFLYNKISLCVPGFLSTCLPVVANRMDEDNKRSLVSSDIFFLPLLLHFL
jgi:hypothetical protein